MQETVRVLTERLPDPPAWPEPGVTSAAARHVRDRIGAVLFLRLWRDGNWDSDVAIAERGETDWVLPGGCSGGGWLNPYERPLDGWDGEALFVCGSHSVEWSERDSQRRLTAVHGMAARRVAHIVCTTPSDSVTYEVDAPLGSFVIVVEGDEEPRLTALDERGVPITTEAP